MGKTKHGIERKLLKSPIWNPYYRGESGIDRVKSKQIIN